MGQTYKPRAKIRKLLVFSYLFLTFLFEKFAKLEKQLSAQKKDCLKIWPTTKNWVYLIFLPFWLVIDKLWEH